MVRVGPFPSDPREPEISKQDQGVVPMANQVGIDA